MRDPSPGTDVKPAPSDARGEDSGKPPTSTSQEYPSSAPSGSQPAEELKKRFEREQAIAREELANVARREREAAREELSMALLRERIQSRGEAERAQRLAKQLEKKERDLNVLDAFYKAQLAQLEKKGLGDFRTASRQFQEAAASMEARLQPRSTEPVCSSLQARVLHCYRENLGQTLRCSDVAKEYMQCINKVTKNMLVNHG
ncbi:MICOS complex subunit mic25a-like isoform X2 [Scleropages formosus]|nr:MICOS complex subunit mic25a-like isoform X2 [Scleropages formosus]